MRRSSATRVSGGGLGWTEEEDSEPGEMFQSSRGRGIGYSDQNPYPAAKGAARVGHPEENLQPYCSTKETI